MKMQHDGMFWHQHFDSKHIFPYKVLHLKAQLVGFYCVKAELTDQWSGVVMHALNKMMEKK